MRKTRLFQRLLALAVAAVVVLGAGAAWAADEPAANAKLSAGKTCSFSGFGHQLGRGLVNIGLCWLELPYQVKTRLTTPDEERPTTVFTQVFDFVAGTAEGVVHTAERFTAGVIEVVVSPIPPYTPLCDPPYPPLLSCFHKKAPVSAPKAPAAPHF